ncbi:MAG: hypothetical protein LC785_09000 [Acidobacteria bacterium]|nr:hypothetical protein [Acidobacteriota bacterium]MCA1642072.1 hypothetical protein [Acidobacteriota bacterium]
MRLTKRRAAPTACAALALACVAAPAIRAAPLRQPPAKPRPVPQKSKPSATGSADIAEQQARARALDVLRSVGDDAKGWKDAAAAARVGSQAADLLWDADADAARAYLVRAWEAAARVEEPKQAQARMRNISPRTEARQDVLLVARRRDRALAERWLGQMAEDAEAASSSQPRGVFDDRTPRSTVLLQMALSTAATNPQAAAELANESLRDGVSFGFQNVLIAIQEKDFKLAASVFRNALARLQSAGLADPNEIYVLASYLYTPGRVVGANTTEDRGSFPLAVVANPTSVKAAAQLDPALVPEFLRAAAGAVLNSALPAATANPPEAARAQIGVIRMLVSQMSAPQFAELSAALQRRGQQLEVDAQFSNAPRPATPDRPAPLAGESLKEYMARRVDGLEEAARKETDPLARDIAYAKAALATEVDTYERGFSLSQNIKDAQLRQGVADWLTYRATLAAIREGAKEGNLERAAALAKRNGEPAERAASYVLGARKLFEAKDAARAGEWLQEARAVLKSAEPDEDAARAAFGVAALYAEFDELIAAQALAEAVKIANQAGLQGNWEDERAPLAKRFAGLTAQDYSFGTGGFGVKAAAAAFGARQFEEALGALEKIAAPEARGVALVALCRAVLQRPKNPPPKNF